jgi:hypothetical protein
MTSGMGAQPMPTTMTVTPGRSPMMPMTSTSGNPALLPQN